MQRPPHSAPSTLPGSASPQSVPPKSSASIGDLLLLALLVAATSYLSLTLTRVPSGVAAVWVGNGLMVGWLLARPTQAWPRYLVAGLLAGVVARGLSGDSIAYALALTVINTIEVLVVAGAVRRHIEDVAHPDRWLALGRIATLATLLACAVSGTLAAATATVILHASFPATFMIWYPAHVLGMVLVATMTALAHDQGIRLLGRPGRRLDFALSMLAIVVVTGAIFAQSRFPLLFLAFPPLLWAAYRHRFAGVVVGIALLSVIASVATALGHGPITLTEDLGDTGRIFMVQTLVGAACLLTLPLALVMAERGRLAAKVRESEAHYRMLADYAHDVVFRMRPDGAWLYVSPSVTDLLGWDPVELLKARPDLVHPDERARRHEELSTLLATGVPYTSTYRMRHKDGHYLWIEAVGSLIPGTHANDIIYAGRDVGQRIAVLEQLKASQQELEQLARVDSLTGLANRRQFDERLALALARSRRHGTPIALLYMDIDHFKRINDSLGHLAGDAVLKTFAQRLSTCVRTEDLVARLGGDEFAMLVEDSATVEGAEAIARKLVDCVSRPNRVDDSDTTITTSIGIAFCLRATTAEELLWYADKALYVAKGNGRNTFHLVTME